MTRYFYPPLPGILNPHEPGKDRYYFAGTDKACMYCYCKTHDNPRDYVGEVHALDCPVRAHVEAVESGLTGQRSLFQVLEESQ